ncbi:MAG TPA: hypothetical protein VMF90_18845 [Rhizobiaceae bacterium]|nr:hypothetical protein [Rhizobiaceae bacterium]
MDTAADDKDLPEGADAAPVEKPRASLIGNVALFLIAPVLAGAGVFAGMALMEGEPEIIYRAGVPLSVTETVGSVQLDLDAAAETSFSYSFELSEMLKGSCGEVVTDALAAASRAETLKDVTLVIRSREAATRRAASITTAKSCNRVLVEIELAEVKAKKQGY